MVFGKKKPVTPSDSGARSVMKRSISFEGNLKMTGPLYLDGFLDGTIVSEGESANLVVGVSGKIKGDVQAANLEVYGSIVGNVDCTSIKIHAKAQIKGDISYHLIHMEPEARIEGELHNKVHQQVPSSAGKTHSAGSYRLKPNQQKSSVDAVDKTANTK